MIDDSINLAIELVGMIIPLGEEEEGELTAGDVLQSCDSIDQYYKLKYSRVSKEHKFEDDLYDHKTLLEIVMISDTIVSQSKRFSIQVLDLLGDVGGFNEAIFSVLAIFASAVSARMLLANIA